MDRSGSIGQYLHVVQILLFWLLHPDIVIRGVSFLSCMGCSVMVALLVSQTGTPVLVFSTPSYDHRIGSGQRFTGRLMIDPGAGGLRVTCPPEIIATGSISGSGFAPDIMAHVAQFHGIWAVGVDEIGRVVDEWPAMVPGSTAESILSIFSAKVGPVVYAGDRVPGEVYRALLSTEQIVAVGLPDSWPPRAHGDDAPSGSLPHRLVGLKELDRIASQCTYPAGGFIGPVGSATNVSDEMSRHLQQRTSNAKRRFQSVIINGLSLDDTFGSLFDYGVKVVWASNVRPALRSPRSGPTPSVMLGDGSYGGVFPPPFGWDWVNNRILLSPDLPEALDPCWLGGCLYTAYASIRNQSISSFLSSAILSPFINVPSIADLTGAISREAARYWLLTAEIARALPATSGSSSLSPSALYQQLAWGGLAQSVLPPLTPEKSDAYDHHIASIGVPTLAKALYAHVVPFAHELHGHLVFTRERLFGSRRVSPFPVPPNLRAQAPASSEPAARLPEHSVIIDECAIYTVKKPEPDCDIEILFEVNGPVDLGPTVTVYFNGQSPGSIGISIKGSTACFMLPDVSYSDLLDVTSKKYVYVLLGFEEALSNPQKMEVVRVGNTERSAA